MHAGQREIRGCEDPRTWFFSFFVRLDRASCFVLRALCLVLGGSLDKNNRALCLVVRASLTKYEARFLKLVPALGTVYALGQDLRTIFAHQHGVLKLGR